MVLLFIKTGGSILHLAQTTSRSRAQNSTVIFLVSDWHSWHFHAQCQHCVNCKCTCAHQCTPGCVGLKVWWGQTHFYLEVGENDCARDQHKAGLKSKAQYFSCCTKGALFGYWIGSCTQLCHFNKHSKLSPTQVKLIHNLCCIQNEQTVTLKFKWLGVVFAFPWFSTCGCDVA